MFIDSVFYRALMVSFNVLVFSLIFLFSSFFGLLIGPALIALLYTFSKLKPAKYLDNIKLYFVNYRKNFLRGLALQICLYLSMIFLRMVIVHLGTNPASMIIKFVLVAFMIGFILNFALVLGKVKDNILKSYRFAFIISVNFLSLTVLVGIAGIIIRFILLKYSFILLIVYFVGIMAVIHIKLFNKRVDEIL